MCETLATSGPCLTPFLLLGLSCPLLFVWLILPLWVSDETLFPTGSSPSVFSHDILSDLVPLMCGSLSPHPPLCAHPWHRTWNAVGTDHVCGEGTEAVGFPR